MSSFIGKVGIENFSPVLIHDELLLASIGWQRFDGR